MRDFYPRPPRGGRRVHAGVGCVIVGFLSTPSARRATFEIIYGILLIVQFLSTPSARRATGIRLGYKATVKFLSTPSARRATHQNVLPDRRCHYFYPRPPRGGRLGHIFPTSGTFAISIHALREEGDHRDGRPGGHCYNFYPRPPRGGRHFDALQEQIVVKISIHALREEGDLRCTRP